MAKLAGKEYIGFVKNFTESVNIMSKNFFLIVTYQPAIIKTKGGIDKLFGKKTIADKNKDKSDFEESRTQLEQRISVVEQGLTRTGLRMARLGTEEVVELLYKIYNPGESEKPIQLS